MGVRKLFLILGGILAIVAIFLLAFDGFSPFYVYGLGLFLNLDVIFSSGEVVTIIVGIVFIIASLSGLMILIGVKIRFLAIIGSILAILLSMFFILIGFGVLPPEIAVYGLLFFHGPIVEGIIPFHFAIGGVGLATYVLLAGGVLGFIGGIMSEND